MSLIASRVGKVAALGVGLGGVYNYGTRHYDREIEFWRRMAIPVFHYRLVDRIARDWTDEEREAAFAPLHARYLSRIEKMIQDQGGLFIKIAQFVTNRADIVPADLMPMLERFQDACPMQALEEDELKQMVAESLGAPLDTIFREFDGIPMSSASIGQVHRAVLLDGTKVAVKVQHPNAEAVFRRDLQTQRVLCHLAAPVHLGSLDEIEKQFKTEFDYRLEAVNLEQIRRNIMPVFGHRVCIPKPYHEYTSKTILTMEFLEGEKMATRLRRQLRDLTLETGKSEKEILDEMRARGPLTSGAIRRFNFSRNMQWIAKCISSLTRSLLTLHPVQLPTKPGPLLDIPTLMDTLVEVHGHEMLIDGAYNGDPHGGNILVCPDGRLGLIDYGQVKRMTNDKRRKLARVYWICRILWIKLNASYRCVRQFDRR